MRLTECTKSAGCAGKLGPKELDLAIQGVPWQYILDVLIGYDKNGDAGVYQLPPDLAVS